MARLTDRFERIARGEKGRPFALFQNVDAVLLQLPLDEITPDPSQPRRDLGELEGLQASIAEHGILQPLIVSPTEENRYLLIAGERRYTAAKQLGLETVPAVIRSVEEHQRLELQLIENLHRKDLNPLEEAHSYQRLMDEYNLTQEEVGRRVGKSVASINQTLRLLTLSDTIQTDFQTSEKVSKSVLLEIAKQPNEENQNALWEQAQRGELTVKKARAQKPSKRPDGMGQGTPPMPASLRSTQNFRYPIQTEEAVVTVTFNASRATLDEIITALEQALEGERERRKVTNFTG